MRSVVQLPTSADEFVPLLQDESWCTSYAFKLRWPDGFICPACGFHDQQAQPQKRIVCRFCSRCTSITAGTLLHGSKKKLSRWFQAVWWVSCEPASLTIKNLQQRLRLNSYQTAWLWMTKLRAAMKLMEQPKCRGIVLIDAETDDDSNLRQPAQLLAAVESIADGWANGRLKMMFCDRLEADVVASFCQHSVDPDSTIAAPGREPFTAVNLVDLLYTVDSTKMFHEVVQKIFASFRRWCAQKRCHSSHFRSLQDRLEEFCFLQNCALYSSKLHLFEALASAMLQHCSDRVGSQPAAADLQRG